MFGKAIFAAPDVKNDPEAAKKCQELAQRAPELASQLVMLCGQFVMRTANADQGIRLLDAATALILDCLDADEQARKPSKADA